MEFTVFIILYVAAFMIGDIFAEYMQINRYIIMPYCIFAVIAVQTMRGKYEKVTNKRKELIKVFLWMSCISAIIAFVDYKYIP